jgi:hypothetical protein
MLIFIKKPTLKKLISVITTAFFSFSAIAPAANASAAFIVQPQTVIPMSIGKITGINNLQSGTVIVNIQDLHAHPETQKNIVTIINTLAERYKVSEIYAEGGWGNIDTGWISRVKNETLKKLLIEQLLESGSLTAGEYYAVTSKTSLPLKGLEDKRLHAENIKKLAEIERSRARYETVISAIDKETGILNKLYVNPKSVRFDKILKKQALGKISDKKFYEILEKYVSAINSAPEKYNNTAKISFDDYPNIGLYLNLARAQRKTDNTRATAELHNFITNLKNSLPYGEYARLVQSTDNFQNGEEVIEFISSFLSQNPELAAKYKNLNILAEGTKLAKLLNPVELITETRRLSEKIKFALSYNDTEVEIAFITDFQKYFSDYLTASLTESDWLYVKENLNTYTSLYAKYAAYNHLKSIEADFSALNKYY